MAWGSRARGTGCEVIGRGYEPRQSVSLPGVAGPNPEGDGVGSAQPLPLGSSCVGGGWSVGGVPPPSTPPGKPPKPGRLRFFPCEPRPLGARQPWGGGERGRGGHCSQGSLQDRGCVPH